MGFFILFNYLLILVGAAILVLLAVVLIKLNRALNIWLSHNS